MYGVVVGLVSVVNMMFINGSLQAVSKLVSERNAAKPVLKTARRVQWILGGIVFLTFFMLSGGIARFLNDEVLIVPLRVASFIMLFYAFYSIHIGALNGLKNFKAQGLFDMGYATIKLILILVLANTVLTLNGALAGFSTAAFLICVASFIYIRRNLRDEETAEEISYKRLLYFQFTIMSFAFMMNLVMNTDLFLVKKLTDPAVSNLHAGYYTAGLTISRIPYMVLISLNFILFPLIHQRRNPPER